MPAYEILSHRIFWCLIFVIILIYSKGQWDLTINEIKNIIKNYRRVFGVILAALFINSNWFLYIWAVNNNHLVDASLGFYINPLISVLLGMIFLKERFNATQYTAFLIALSGVLFLIFKLGHIPYISLILATSFAFYSLLKKTYPTSPLTSIGLDTLIASFLSIVVIIYFQKTGIGHFGWQFPINSLLLIGAGVVTAIPLLLFVMAAKHMTLSLLGFIQYISPTMTLLIGIFIYHESFTINHFIAFLLIWLGLLLFSWAQAKAYASLETRLHPKKIEN